MAGIRGERCRLAVWRPTDKGRAWRAPQHTATSMPCFAAWSEDLDESRMYGLLTLSWPFAQPETAHDADAMDGVPGQGQEVPQSRYKWPIPGVCVRRPGTPRRTATGPPRHGCRGFCLSSSVHAASQRCEERRKLEYREVFRRWHARCSVGLRRCKSRVRRRRRSCRTSRARPRPPGSGFPRSLVRRPGRQSRGAGWYAPGHAH